MAASKGAPDLYSQFLSSAPGAFIASKAGLPRPENLRRYKAGEPALAGPVLIGGKGRLAEPLRVLLSDYPAAQAHDSSFGGLVFDATGITQVSELEQLFEFFQPVIRNLAPSARVVVLGTTPEETSSVDEHVAQRALEGFTRSVGKEIKRGSTAQLVYVSPTASTGLSGVESTLRFLLSAKVRLRRRPRSSSSVLKIPSRPQAGTSRSKARLPSSPAQPAVSAPPSPRSWPATARNVVCADIPAAGEALSETANKVGGTSLALDVTAADASRGPRSSPPRASRRSGHHRPQTPASPATKTLANMDEGRWNMVMNVNLLAPQKITEHLVEKGALKEGGRVVDVSSIAGIAGNRGQTNYGTSKAGVIGLVHAEAPVLAKKNITINAVAPGFIETAMTAAIPFATREAGRRMSSLLQGGETVDVAETVAYFASPASNAVTGQVVRVCGQSLLGA